MSPLDVSLPRRFATISRVVPDHYFAPHLEFAPGIDPAWIRDAIQAWEQGEEAAQPFILGSNGTSLPPIPALVPGLVEYRWGRFAEDPGVQYRLRLEVIGARRRVRIGLLLSGPGLPHPATRGGGELVRRLASNWRHKPQADCFPDRVRELRSSADVAEFVGRLLDPARKVPIMLVTRRSGSDELVADAERLRDGQF